MKKILLSPMLAAAFDALARAVDPKSYAMLLAGLCVIGAVLRRRAGPY